MSVKSITLKNYKAFKEGKFNLRPITVLLGSNSTGKSSLLKLLLLLSQTAGSNPKPEQVVKLLGKFVDFGEIENLFHKKDIKKTLSLKYELENEIIFQKHRHFFYRHFKIALINILKTHIELLNTLEVFYSETPVSNSLNREVLIQKARKSLLRNITIDELLEYLNENYKGLLLSIRRKISILMKSYSEDVDDFINKDDIRIYESYSFLEIVDSINLLKLFSKIEYINCMEYNIICVKNKLVIKSLRLFNNDEELLRIDLWNKNINKKSFLIKSKFIDERVSKRYLSKFRKSFSIQNLRLFWNKNSIKLDSTSNSNLMMTEPFPATILLMLSNIVEKSIKAFNPNKVKHVSPIRAYPKRYYFVESDYENNTLDTSEHNFLPQFLKSSKKTDVEFINKWLKKFGIEISIEELKEIIHSIKVQQNGIKLDLLDVGFGISQILPVIIQSISGSGEGVVIIEQPEIHIHPKMQSELADFFIELANSGKKKFIIETHSESFLKRLRRRMAEHTVSLEGSISSDNVGIHFIEKDEKTNASIIKNIDITKSGDFEWPKDFYNSEMDDTINFLKYQE